MATTLRPSHPLISTTGAASTQVGPFGSFYEVDHIHPYVVDFVSLRSADETASAGIDKDFTLPLGAPDEGDILVFFGGTNSYSWLLPTDWDQGDLYGQGSNYEECFTYLCDGTESDTFTLSLPRYGEGTGALIRVRNGDYDSITSTGAADTLDRDTDTNTLPSITTVADSLTLFGLRLPYGNVNPSADALLLDYLQSGTGDHASAVFVRETDAPSSGTVTMTGTPDWWGATYICPSITLTIKPKASTLYVDTDGTAGVDCDATTLDAAIDLLPTTWDRDYTIECKASSGTADTTAVSISGFTENGYSLTIQAASGHEARSSGWDATRYRLSVNNDYAITAASDVTLKGLQIDGTGTFARDVVRLSGPDYFLMDGCRVRSSSTGSNGGVVQSSVCGYVEVRNSIVENTGNPNNDTGINASTSASRKAWIRNCVVTGWATGVGSGYFDTTIQNSVIFNNANDVVDGQDVAIEYCVGDDTEFASGTGNSRWTSGATDWAAAFNGYSTGDFRLKGTSPTLKDAATDLSAFFTTDMDGNTRVAPWDIGANEYVFVGPTSPLRVDTDGTKDYTSLAEAVAALPAVFDQDWVIECEASAGTEDTTGADLNGGGVDFDTNGFTLTIKAAAGHEARSTGIDPSRYRITRLGDHVIHGELVTGLILQGLQIRQTSTANTTHGLFLNGCLNALVERCYIERTNATGATQSSIAVQGASGGAVIRNTIVYNSGTIQSNTRGFLTNISSGAAVKLDNCAAYNYSDGFITGSNDGDARNCVSFGNATADFTGTFVGVNNCASDDGTGTNPVIPADWADVFEDYANGDFSLKVGSALDGQALDLSGEFTTDINDVTRVAPWDIGAAESVGVPPVTRDGVVDATHAAQTAAAVAESNAGVVDGVVTATHAAQTATAEADYTAGGQGSFEQQVSADYDDGHEIPNDGSANWTNASVWLRDQKDNAPTASRGLFIFRGLTVPAGKIVTSAVIELVNGSTNTAGVRADIHLEDTFGSQNGLDNPDILNRVKRAEKVTWNAGIDSTLDVTHETPELFTLLNEMIRQKGDIIGADLGFIFDPLLDATLTFYPRAHDYSASTAAKLKVTYDDPVPATVIGSRVHGDTLLVEFDKDVLAPDTTGVSFSTDGAPVTVSTVESGSGTKVIVFGLSRAITGSEASATLVIDSGTTSLTDVYGVTVDDANLSVANTSDQVMSFVNVLPSGHEIQLTSIIAGVWDQDTYQHLYFYTRSMLTFLVDELGLNKRSVAAVFRAATGGQVFSRSYTDGDTVQTTFSLDGAIDAAETVEVLTSWESPHEDVDGEGGTVNIGDTIPIGTSVTNNSTITMPTTTGSITCPPLEVVTPEGKMGPCVVNAKIRIEDWLPGNRCQMHDAEVEWWLTGDQTDELYRLVDDPEAARTDGKVDYTTEGAIKSHSGVTYILSPGTYTLNCRVTVKDDDSHANGGSDVRTSSIVINPDGRATVNVKASGGNYTTLAAAFAGEAGNDDRVFVIEGGHIESITSTLQFGGNNWRVIWDGVGNRPELIETGASIFQGDYGGHYGALIERLNLIPTTNVYPDRGGYTGITGGGTSGFVGVVDCDFNGEFTEGIGGPRFNNCIGVDGPGFPLVAINCRCDWTSGYSYSGGTNQFNVYEGNALYGCSLGKSWNESCVRLTGQHRYFALAYCFLQNNNSKSALRTTAGSTICSVFRSVFEDGNIWIGSQNISSTSDGGPRGANCIRIDSLRIVRDQISVLHRCGGIRIVNTICDGIRFATEGTTEVATGEFITDVVYEFCSVKDTVDSTGFYAGSPVDDRGAWEIRTYGCAMQQSVLYQYAYNIGIENDDGGGRVRGFHNLYDNTFAKANFVRQVRTLAGAQVPEEFHDFAYWTAKAYNVGEQQTNFTFDTNWLPSVQKGVDVRTATQDYWGNDRGTSSIAGAVHAAPVLKSARVDATHAAQTATAVAETVAETIYCDVVGSHAAQTAAADALFWPARTCVAAAAHAPQLADVVARAFTDTGGIGYPLLDPPDRYRIRKQKPDVYKLPRRST